MKKGNARVKIAMQRPKGSKRARTKRGFKGTGQAMAIAQSTTGCRLPVGEAPTSRRWRWLVSPLRQIVAGFTISPFSSFLAYKYPALSNFGVILNFSHKNHFKTLSRFDLRLR